MEPSLNSVTVYVDNLPTGAIIIWYGKFDSIPIGWNLCDGETYNNVQTPNLINKFVLGCDDDTLVKSVGGAETCTLSIDNLPSHNHYATCSKNGEHNHNIGRRGVKAGGDYPMYGGNDSKDNNNVFDAGSHNHSIDINNTGEGKSFSILPPYAKLYYIIKTK